MIIAIWLIAICELIRIVQNTVQLLAIKQDTGARDNAYKAFVDSLKDTDREMVRKLLEEFRRGEEDETD